MYQKYQTEALVLGSRESGEADRTISLYTRDFGLIRARATSIRAERSKMRFALQHYSHAFVSLIRGKRAWRIAGASAFRNASGDTSGSAAFARIAELVLRLVTGEEENAYLFSALSEAHDALMSAGGGSASGGRGTLNIVPTIEIVCVARVLYALGYISAEALDTALFTHTAYGESHLAEAETLRPKLLSSINRAISETHL